MGSWVNKNAQSDGEKFVLAVGETFEGTFEGTGTYNGKHGEFVGHTLKNEAGEPFFATGASLTNQFADVTSGSRIRVTYNGMKDTKAGRTVKDYEVQVYVEDAAAKGQAV